MGAFRWHMCTGCIFAALITLHPSMVTFNGQTTRASVPDPSVTDVDPVVGTWELDVAASTFVPGPPPKSEIRLYEPEHEGIKAIVHNIRRRP